MSALRKILLVENDDFTRYMMREIIATLDIQVEIAESGQDGLNRLMAHPGDFCCFLNSSGLRSYQFFIACKDDLLA